MHMEAKNMKNRMIVLFTGLVLGSTAWAQQAAPNNVAVGSYSDTVTEEGYTHGINVGAGLSVGQPVLSVDYEYRLSNHFGIGAYGSYAAKKGNSRPGVGSLGADFKAHVAIQSIDVYLRPGLGVTYFESGSSEKVAFLSPIFAYGVMLRVAKNIAVGVEHLQIFNWSSSDQPAKSEAVLAAVQWRF